MVIDLIFGPEASTRTVASRPCQENVDKIPNQRECSRTWFSHWVSIYVWLGSISYNTPFRNSQSWWPTQEGQSSLAAEKRKHPVLPSEPKIGGKGSKAPVLQLGPPTFETNRGILVDIDIWLSFGNFRSNKSDSICLDHTDIDWGEYR